MTAKLLALTSVIGLATVCVVRAQSPIPSEASTASPSPAEKASPSPAEKAASPSPAESPTASPKAKPTPKKEKAERKARPAASPIPAGRTTEERSTHRRRAVVLAWYGLTPRQAFTTGTLALLRHNGEGQIHERADAIKAGYKRAPKGR